MVAAGSQAHGRGPEGPRELVTKRARYSKCPRHESCVARRSLHRRVAVAAVAVVAVPSGGCRVAVGGEPAPGEKIAQRYYFKPLHIELVLGAAGVGDRPIDQPPDAVATVIRRTVRSLGAPFQTEPELRADAEQEVDKILAKVEATNASGGLRELNRSYKAYRQRQIARAERAVPYSKFIEERYTVSIVRSVASVGRMI